MARSPERSRDSRRFRHTACSSVMPQSVKVKFQVRDAVTGVAVYGRTVLSPVMQSPGQKFQTTAAYAFAPYITNPYILSELGTFNACAIATAYDGNDQFIGDTW